MHHQAPRRSAVQPYCSSNECIRSCNVCLVGTDDASANYPTYSADNGSAAPAYTAEPVHPVALPVEAYPTYTVDNTQPVQPAGTMHCDPAVTASISTATRSALPLDQHCHSISVTECSRIVTVPPLLYSLHLLCFVAATYAPALLVLVLPPLALLCPSLWA